MAAFGELVGLLIAAPFLALADWFGYLARLPPGQQELAKACHGIGMLALVALWLELTGFGEFVFALTVYPENPFNWIPPAIASWGLGWFLINGRFAAQAVGRPQRATLIWRALLKIAVGYAAWSYVGNAGPSSFSAGWSLLALALYAVAIWCLATGATKLLLMMWHGGRDQAHPMVASDIKANEFDWDDGRMR